MQTLDFLTIFIFTLIILVAGLSFGKQGGDMKSFFSAGEPVPCQSAVFPSSMRFFFSAALFVVVGLHCLMNGVLVAITIQLGHDASAFPDRGYLAPIGGDGCPYGAAFLIHGFAKRPAVLYFIFSVAFLGYTGAFPISGGRFLMWYSVFDYLLFVLFLGTIVSDFYW